MLDGYAIIEPLDRFAEFIDAHCLGGRLLDSEGEKTDRAPASWRPVCLALTMAIRRFAGNPKILRRRLATSRAIVKKFLEHGANPNQNILNKETFPGHTEGCGRPIELGTERKDDGLVESLLQHSAKTNTITADV